MRQITRVALRGAIGSVPACSIVMLWARQVSISAFFFWALVLAPLGSCVAPLIWAVSRRRPPSAFWGAVCALLGAVAGTLLIYLEALIFGALRSDLLADPVAASNIVPGVATGVFATYFALHISPVKD